MTNNHKYFNLCNNNIIMNLECGRLRGGIIIRKCRRLSSGIELYTAVIILVRPL